MTLQALRGTADLLAEDLPRWKAVEQTARHTTARHGYREIRTPILEEAALFLRSIGETSDIVQKEMFAFQDRGNRTIVLRPEGTSAIVRAYLEHNLHKTQGLARLFYLGPMFRAERPQAGRLRQFHQFGVEAIGSYSPWIDAETIILCLDILKDCGLRDAVLWLSSIGCRKDQAASAEQLRQRLAPHRKKLCEDCQGRFDKNVFRVLDCKRPACHALAWDIAGSPFILCGDCQNHFGRVRDALRQSNIAFDDTHIFARGLDYYTRTVFEVRAKGLGAQDAVAAGGRYDHLVEELGGPPSGAVGFAAGIERLLMAVQAAAEPLEAANTHRHGLYIAAAQPDVIGNVFQLVRRCRQEGLTTLMDCEGRSLKAQLREADKLRCRWVAILGEQELRQHTVAVKDLEQGQQQDVSLEGFVDTMRQHAKGQQAHCR